MSILSREREFPVATTEVEPLDEEREKLPEAEGYIERVEKGGLKKPVSLRRQVLVSPADQPVKVVVLPVTARTFVDPKNWQKGVTFALRWLLELVKKTIKKYPNQTEFKK